MKHSTLGVLAKTLPFVGIRLAVYVLTALAALLWLGLIVLVASAFGNNGALIFIIGLGGMLGIFKLAGHFVIYMIKAAHVAVITEYITTDKLPEQGQIKYGIETVKANIGAAASVSVLDLLIRGAVKQVIRLFNVLESFLSLIPGLKVVFQLFNAIVETACNYIDECILGYIFIQKSKNPDANIWKTSADGIVLYAQNWKKIGIGAIKTVVMVWVLKAILFIVTLAGLYTTLDMGIMGFLVILAIMYAVNKALIDPLATVSMLLAYKNAVDLNPEPSVDLYSTITQKSSKFKKILENGNVSNQGQTSYAS